MAQTSHAPLSCKPSPPHNENPSIWTVVEVNPVFNSWKLLLHSHSIWTWHSFEWIYLKLREPLYEPFNTLLPPKSCQRLPHYLAFPILPLFLFLVDLLIRPPSKWHNLRMLLHLAKITFTQIGMQFIDFILCELLPVRQSSSDYHDSPRFENSCECHRQTLQQNDPRKVWKSDPSDPNMMLVH